MHYHLIFELVFPLTYLVVSFLLLALSGLALYSGKPLVLRMRTAISGAALFVAPSLLMCIRKVQDFQIVDSKSLILNLVLPFGAAVCIAAAWTVSKGSLVFGAGQREVFDRVLKRLSADEAKVHSQPSSIDLPNHGARIVIGGNAELWFATVELQIESSDSKARREAEELYRREIPLLAQSARDPRTPRSYSAIAINCYLALCIALSSGLTFGLSRGLIHYGSWSY